MLTTCMAHLLGEEDTVALQGRVIRKKRAVRVLWI